MPFNLQTRHHNEVCGFYRENTDGQVQNAQRQMSTHLVGVTVEVKVLQEACGKLTKQCVVRLVDGPQAPVSVVVGAGARTESSHWIKTYTFVTRH